MLVIPEQVWETLMDEFALMGDANERVAYLDGVRAGETATVTTVTFPHAHLTPRFYSVSAEAMRQAGAHLREHRLARLAQVHTHGNLNCAHSPWDDELAYTQREGAVSIVLPEHARSRPAPTDGTVHVKADDRWVALSATDAAELIRFVPSKLDFRRPEWTAFPTDTKAPSVGVWHRLKRLIRWSSP